MNSKIIALSGLLFFASCDRDSHTKQTIQDTGNSLFITVNSKQQAIEIKTQQEHYNKVDVAFCCEYIDQDPEELLATITKEKDRESAMYLKKYIHLKRRKSEILSTVISLATNPHDYNKIQEILERFAEELTIEQETQLRNILSEANLSAWK